MNKAILLFISLFSASLAACSNNYFHGPGTGWGHMMYFGYGGWFMLLLIILVIGLLIYIVFKGIRAGGGIGLSGETPVDILKKRYARGEITKDEFDRMKKDLSE